MNDGKEECYILLGGGQCYGYTVQKIDGRGFEYFRFVKNGNFMQYKF